MTADSGAPDRALEQVRRSESGDTGATAAIRGWDLPSDLRPTRDPAIHDAPALRR